MPPPSRRSRRLLQQDHFLGSSNSEGQNALANQVAEDPIDMMDPEHQDAEGDDSDGEDVLDGEGDVEDDDDGMWFFH
jgi:hypothetical protein